MHHRATPKWDDDVENCREALVPVADILSLISGKWTILIVRALSGGSMRFSELRRGIDGISQKMLSATLRDLERDGLVKRTVTPTVPPRVDYELTPMGYELHAPLRAVGEWAHGNRERIERARREFAARGEAAGRWGA